MSDSLSRLVEAVRSAGVDIAPGYCEYVRLAFAIANDCGEAGREGFIALCSLSVKFNREKAERLFSNSLKKGDHRIHLGTAFHLAELAGVRLEPPSRPRDTHANNASNANNAAPVSHTRACDNNVETEIEEQVDPFTHLPFFPEGHEWPRMLRQIMAFGQSREQRDVLLLGGLTTLGASLAQTLRFLYGGKWFFSSLQTFVVAPPASGKGVLAWTRMLVQPIHDEIRATVAEEMKKYKKEMTSFNSLGREKAKAEEPGDFIASLRKSPRLTPDPQTCADNIKDGIITRWDLSIQEDDFQAVLSLAEPMYLHAVHILSFLPANEVKNRGMADQERLFITLDTGFTYQSLLEEAEKLKIPKNTACSCLQRWQKQGIVQKGEKRGDYKKT
jgi:hypothetical protein